MRQIDLVVQPGAKCGYCLSGIILVAVEMNAHPSLREPGNLADLQRRRMEILDALPQAEREAYLAAHNAKMSGKPRVRIIS